MSDKTERGQNLLIEKALDNGIWIQDDAYGQSYPGKWREISKDDPPEAIEIEDLQMILDEAKAELPNRDMFTPALEDWFKKWFGKP